MPDGVSSYQSIGDSAGVNYPSHNQILPTLILKGGVEVLYMKVEIYDEDKLISSNRFSMVHENYAVTFQYPIFSTPNLSQRFEGIDGYEIKLYTKEKIKEGEADGTQD